VAFFNNFWTFFGLLFSHLLQKPKNTYAFKTAKNLLKTAKKYMFKALFNVANPPMAVWS
jgi:hypothetical protein